MQSLNYELTPTFWKWLHEQPTADTQTKLNELCSKYSLSESDTSALRTAFRKELNKPNCGKWFGRSNNRIRRNVLAIMRERIVGSRKLLTHRRANKLILELSKLLVMEYRNTRSRSESNLTEGANAAE